MTQDEFFRAFNRESLTFLVYGKKSNKKIKRLAKYFSKRENFLMIKHARKRLVTTLIESDVETLKDADVAFRNYANSKSPSAMSSIFSFIAIIISIGGVLIKINGIFETRTLLIPALLLTLWVIYESGIKNHSDFARWVDSCVKDAIEQKSKHLA